MPSYVIHLSCARRALEWLPEMDTQEQNLFFLGNMIADMCRDKHYTHFWNDETYPMLARRPDLGWFMEKYGDALDEPYVRGYYAHLLLDYLFLDEYWGKHFRFFGVDGRPDHLYDTVTSVEVVEQHKSYDRYAFFSKEWYYGDYDRMNGYFARKYMVEFPNLNLDAAQWEKVRRITEIDWNYAPEAMKRTKEMLQQSVAQTDMYIQGETPELNIFNLQELEMLVTKVAKKVAEL